jgi:hypothetical protein
MTKTPSATANEAARLTHDQRFEFHRRTARDDFGSLRSARLPMPPIGAGLVENIFDVGK